MKLVPKNCGINEKAMSMILNEIRREGVILIDKNCRFNKNTFFNSINLRVKNH